MDCLIDKEAKMRKKLLTVNDVIKALEKVENKDRVVEFIGTDGYIDNATLVFASNYIEDKDGYLVLEEKLK